MFNIFFETSVNPFSSPCMPSPRVEKQATKIFIFMLSIAISSIHAKTREFCMQVISLTNAFGRHEVVEVVKMVVVALLEYYIYNVYVRISSTQTTRTT